MKKVTEVKKLVLHKDRVRVLTSAQLLTVVAAAPNCANTDSEHSITHPQTTVPTTCG